MALLVAPAGATSLYGTLDTSWASSGFSAIDSVPSFFGQPVALAADDSEIAVGYDTSGAEDTAVVVKEKPDGVAPDSGFGTSGVVRVQVRPGLRVEPDDAAVDGSGRVIVVGWVGHPSTGTTDAFVMRLNADGTLDQSFNASGAVPGVETLNDGAHSSEWYHAVVAPDGKIVVMGRADGGFEVRRLNPDGTPDTGFATTGATAPTSDLLVDMDIAADGSIAALGSAGLQTVIWRLKPDGTPDPGFGIAGRLSDSLVPSPADAAAGAVRFDPSGRILVAAGPPGQLLVARYTAAGERDPSFGTGGEASVAVDNFAAAEGLAVHADGSLVASGAVNGTASTADHVVVAAFDASGALDQRFNAAGPQPGVLEVSDPNGGSVATGSPIGKALAADGSVLDVLMRRNGVPFTARVQGTRLPPEAHTTGVPQVATDAATVSGTVNDHGYATQYFAEYGPTTSYGSRSAPVAMTEHDVTTTVSVGLTGLAPDTAYHARLVAVSNGITVTGEDVAFHTASDTAPPPPPPPLPSVPVLSNQPVAGGGQSFSLANLPGAARFTLHDANTSVVCDAAARHIVDITSLPGLGGLTATALGGNDLPISQPTPIPAIPGLPPAPKPPKFDPNDETAIACYEDTHEAEWWSANLNQKLSHQFACSRSRLAFGVVEATGCFTQVPANKLPPSDARRMVDAVLPPHHILVNHSQLVAWANDPLMIDGVRFDPGADGTIVLLPAEDEILCHHVKVSFRGIPLNAPQFTGVDDTFVLSTKPDDPSSGTRLLGTFAGAAGLGNVGGFRFTGAMRIVWHRPGAAVRHARDATGSPGDFGSEVLAPMLLPTSFTTTPGGGARVTTQDVAVDASTDDGFRLDHLHVGVPDAALGGLGLSNVSFDYDLDADRWKATADLDVGIAKLRVSPPPAINGLVVEHGKFKSLGAALDFTPPIAISTTPPVTLDELNFAAGLDPTFFHGGVGMTAAGIFHIKGGVVVAFATPDEPFRLNHADFPEFSDVSEPFYTTTFAAAGTLGLTVPVLGEVPLANAQVIYSYPDFIQASGHVGLDAGPFSISGDIAGAIRVGKGQYAFSGGGRACLTDLLCDGSDLWVTNKGIAGQLEVGPLHPGFVYVYGEGLTIWPIDGTKPSRVYVTVEHPTGVRAATADTTIDVPRGLQGEVVRVQGVGDAPRVAIHGPDGETIAPSSPEQGMIVTKHFRMIVDHADRTTWVGLQDPLPGPYSIEPLPGSTPISDIATNRGVPATKVAATVAKRGAGYTLAYTVTGSPSSTVRFYSREIQIGVVTGGGRGAFTFVPQPGTRQITAEISDGGLPQQSEVVATLNPVRPGTAGTVGGLRVSHHGATLVAAWRPVPGAPKYQVTAVGRDGVTTAEVVRGHRATLAVAPWESGTVSVRAVVPQMRLGAPARVRYGAHGAPRNNLIGLDKLRRRYRTLRHLK